MYILCETDYKFLYTCIPQFYYDNYCKKKTCLVSHIKSIIHVCVSFLIICRVKWYLEMMLELWRSDSQNDIGQYYYSNIHRECGHWFIVTYNYTGSTWIEEEVSTGHLTLWSKGTWLFISHWFSPMTNLSLFSKFRSSVCSLCALLLLWLSIIISLSIYVI